MKLDKRALLAVAVLMASILMMSVLTGCYFFPKEEEVLAPPIKEPEKVNFETMEVKNGSIERNIQCTGSFVSASQTELFYKSGGGRLEKVDVKPGDKVKKGQLLASLSTDNLANDIKLQEIAYKKAQLAYESIRTRHDIEGGDRTELELAELDVESNKVRLDSLNSQMEQSRLYAPNDGEVVYVTDIKLGDIVNAYQTIIRIADPTKLQVEYTDDNASYFKTGMKAELGFQGRTAMGEVVASPEDAPADASETAKKSARIKVDGALDDVAIGDTVSIKLTLEKHEDVIVLPKELVMNFSGRRFVNLLVDGIRQEQDVRVGIENSTQAEILEGLKVGDVVIVR